MNFVPLLTNVSVIGITLATCTLSFMPTATAGRCRTIAQDWDGSVDVRSQPHQNMFNLIATLPNGTRLDVIGRHADWLEIYAPNNRLGTNYQTGWVAIKQTRQICFRDDQPRRDQNDDDDD